MSRGNIFGHNFRKLLFLFGYVFDFFGQENILPRTPCLKWKEGDKGIMGGVGSQLNELANTKRE